MKPEWHLRTATPADGQQVAQTFRSSFGLLEFLPTLHTPEEDLTFFARVIERQRVTVADRRGRVVGLMSEAESWVDHLYVHPDYLGQGIGSALIVRAQDQQEHLQLWCFQRNARARRFYEAHGFAASRFTDGGHNEEQEPDLLYEWRRARAPT